MQYCSKIYKYKSKYCKRHQSFEANITERTYDILVMIATSFMQIDSLNQRSCKKYAIC